MYPAEPTARPRRFTILDGTLLTVVMAMAFLAARSTWPRFELLVRNISWGRVTDPVYLDRQILSCPPRWLKMASAPTLIGHTLANTWDAEARGWRRDVPEQGLALATLQQGVICILPILVYLVFALLLLRIVRPRPPWRELLCQPGCTACLAVAGVLCFGAWFEILAGTPVPLAIVPPAVTTTWATQLAARRWRPESSWLDRAGRGLGLCWVATGIIALG